MAKGRAGQISTNLVRATTGQGSCEVPQVFDVFWRAVLPESLKKAFDLRGKNGKKHGRKQGLKPTKTELTESNGAPEGKCQTKEKPGTFSGTRLVGFFRGFGAGYLIRYVRESPTFSLITVIPCFLVREPPALMMARVV